MKEQLCNVATAILILVVNRDAAFALDRKEITVLNSYSTKGIAGVNAQLGPDGNIWVGSLYGQTGMVTRLDPKTPHKIVSELKVDSAITNGVMKKIESPDGKFRFMLASGCDRYYCFDNNANLVATSKCPELAQYFEVSGRKLLFSKEEATLFEVKEGFDLLELPRLFKTHGFGFGIPNICSSASILDANTNPALIFVTMTRREEDKVWVDFSRFSPPTWSVVTVPLSSGKANFRDIILSGERVFKGQCFNVEELKKVDQHLVDQVIAAYESKLHDQVRVLLSQAEAKYPLVEIFSKVKCHNSEEVSAMPTIIPGLENDRALLITKDHGRVLEATRDSLRCNPVLTALSCVSQTPIVNLGNQQFSVIGEDLRDDNKLKRYIFSPDGKLSSMVLIQSLNNSPIKAKIRGYPALFRDSKNRLNAMLGFEDGNLRIIDVETGITVGEFKFSTALYMPQQLNDSDFFITEVPVFQLTKEAEKTQHYLIRVKDSGSI